MKLKNVFIQVCFTQIKIRATLLLHHLILPQIMGKLHYLVYIFFHLLGTGGGDTLVFHHLVYYSTESRIFPPLLTFEAFGAEMDCQGVNIRDHVLQLTPLPIQLNGLPEDKA